MKYSTQTLSGFVLAFLENPLQTAEHAVYKFMVQNIAKYAGKHKHDNLVRYYGRPIKTNVLLELKQQVYTVH